MRYLQRPTMFHRINNPPKWLLDGLLSEESAHNCHDCNALPGTVHLDGCDTARCSVCKGQLLSCPCPDGQPDIWTGLWPGIKECYEHGYVVYDTATKSICFDLNRWSFEIQNKGLD